MSGESGDLQRPHGGGDRLPAGAAGGPRRDRPIGAASPWTAGRDPAWWAEDSATPASTSTPRWRADARVGGPGASPAATGPAPRPTDAATDELPAVAATPDELPRLSRSTDEFPRVPANTDELPRVPANTDELPRVSASTDELPRVPANTDELPRVAAGRDRTRARHAAAENPPVAPEAAVKAKNPPAVTTDTPTPAEATAEAEPATAPGEAAAFWLPVEEVSRDGSGWPAQRMRGGRGPGRRPHGEAPPTRPRKPPKPPRSPAVGLVSLVLLSLLAAFFAWVSAEPLWLAVGHGRSGNATVSRCTGDGVQQRCVGTFTANGGGFTTERVPLLGIHERQRAEGTQVAARMVDAGGRGAYVGSGVTLHLRWALGLALVLLCGAGIVWGTGALRLLEPRSRRRATAVALTGPLLMAAAFFAAAF
ncbi:hypothetical protein SAMN05444365_101442 [Micromonospora pattaloongensis]|uniref:Uncharacterized protein n=1 Tax=Micromonospora pattaloongensis TaxID=405436 RepID=A0A1H3GK13_9ACTN|nr:hypothetical protein [Micromonospora pattaloongensis]SDY03437.1 hypothetical protein SAMN05444365_101442 [Micromonospora pattaloongensis]